MGRAHFFTDRAIVVRGQSEDSLGVKTKVADVEMGDWIPCRLREPDGDTDFERVRHDLQPTHVLHFDIRDVAGQRVSVSQSDTFRIYQRVDDVWVQFPEPFRIIGTIEPKRRRTRLVAYTVMLYAPKVEY